MVISTSNLVGIIAVGVSKSNKPEVKIWRTFSIQNAKITENVAKSPKFCTVTSLTGNLGQGIERRCLNLHRIFINNCFCTGAVQMLLKMAEVQYGKLTSTRTTVIRHFRATLTDRVISRMRTNSWTAFITALYAIDIFISPVKADKLTNKKQTGEHHKHTHTHTQA